MIPHRNLEQRAPSALKAKGSVSIPSEFATCLPKQPVNFSPQAAQADLEPSQPSACWLWLLGNRGLCLFHAYCKSSAALRCLLQSRETKWASMQARHRRSLESRPRTWCMKIWRLGFLLCGAAVSQCFLGAKGIMHAKRSSRHLGRLQKVGTLISAWHASHIPQRRPLGWAPGGGLSDDLLWHQCKQVRKHKVELGSVSSNPSLYPVC